MTLPDLSQPSTVTGLRRACFELCVGISAQKALEEIGQAMMEHATRATIWRIQLELADKLDVSEPLRPEEIN